MPHTTQASYDAAPHHPRSLMHTFTVTFCITFFATFLTLLIVLSFLDPAFILFLVSSLTPFVSAFTSSLTPIIMFVLKTSAKLLAIYLFYSLARAIHFCYYMKKRQDERQTHQDQVFGHAKVWFVNEWYVSFMTIVWIYRLMCYQILPFTCCIAASWTYLSGLSTKKRAGYLHRSNCHTTATKLLFRATFTKQKSILPKSRLYKFQGTKREGKRPEEESKYRSRKRKIHFGQQDVERENVKILIQKT